VTDAPAIARHHDGQPGSAAARPPCAEQRREVFTIDGPVVVHIALTRKAPSHEDDAETCATCPSEG